MGVVLDSSILIAAERRKQLVSELLVELGSEYAETKFLLSSITTMELEHGWHRASSPEIAALRRRYLDEVFTIIPVEPFTHEMGILAAKLDVDARTAGKVIPTTDLLIGATALHYGYAVATRNVRHLKMIPGLTVLSF